MRQNSGGSTNPTPALFPAAHIPTRSTVFGIYLVQRASIYIPLTLTPLNMADQDIHSHEEGEERSWAGDFDPLADPEERRVLFAAFDSFRCVERG